MIDHCGRPVTFPTATAPWVTASCFLFQERQPPKSLLADLVSPRGQMAVDPRPFAFSALKPRRYMIEGHGHPGPPEDHPGGSSCGSERLFRCRGIRHGQCARYAHPAAD